MKTKFLFLSFILVALWSCQEDKCNYKRHIRSIQITDWGNTEVPQNGVIYIYKPNRNFKEVIDSSILINIRRSDVAPSNLLCIPDEGAINYEKDLRIILDDTLFYDVSCMKLSWIKEKMWVTGGPWEHSVVSSLRINGYLSNDTTIEGEIAFSNRFVRIKENR